MKKQRVIYALAFLFLLFVEVAIALFVHDDFIRPYVGDMLVTVLICCFFRIWFPKSAKALPLLVFLFSIAVEIGQYFDLVQWIGLGNNKFISVLLGRTFSVADIFCYAVGCFLFFMIDFFFTSMKK